MKSSNIPSATLLAIGVFLLSHSSFAQEAATGAAKADAPAPGTASQDFQPLFNGQNLDGWGGPTDSFQVKNGAMSARAGEGGTIYTQDVFADFIARLEYQLDPGGEAGVAIRFPGSGNPAYVGMCRIQLRNESDTEATDLEPRARNGSAYGIVAAQQGAAKAPGEWNSLEITVKGSTIKVVLNGKSILESDLANIDSFMDDHPHPGKNRKSGHFGVTASDETARFRGIAIQRLKRR